MKEQRTGLNLNMKHEKIDLAIVLVFGTTTSIIRCLMNNYGSLNSLNDSERSDERVLGVLRGWSTGECIFNSKGKSISAHLQPVSFFGVAISLYASGSCLGCHSLVCSSKDSGSWLLMSSLVQCRLQTSDSTKHLDGKWTKSNASNQLICSTRRVYGEWCEVRTAGASP